MSENNDSLQAATANRNIVMGGVAALAILGISTITYSVAQNRAQQRKA